MDYRQQKRRRKRMRPALDSLSRFTLPRKARIALAILTLALALWTTHSVWEGIQKAESLRDRGVRAEGIVTGVIARWSNPTRLSSSFKTFGVNYEFSDRDGKHWQGRSWIGEEQSSSLQRDGRLEILYLPEDPTVNAPAQFLRAGPYSALWICALLIVIALILIYAAWRSGSPSVATENPKARSRKERRAPPPDSVLDV